MFIGHFGVALAAKRAAPTTSLATLFAASAFVDLLWPTFVLLGLESFRIVPGFTAVTPIDFTSYPYSHSLLMGVVWSLAFGAIYALARPSRRGAVVLGLLVLSHWVLDAVVHVKDLPLYPGSSIRAGLGLWNSLTGTLLVESVLFILGAWIYLANTRPLDRVGRYGIWVLYLLLVAAYLANTFGPPPESVQQIAYGAYIGTAVTLFLAWWADRHRVMHLAP